jgi:hypothetical protein
MKMMLNNAELEEELEDIWEHVLDQYDAPRLSIVCDEPNESTDTMNGTWLWMQEDGYNLLKVDNGHAKKIVTDDLDEILFRALLPSVHDIASSIDGDCSENEINVFSSLGERWEHRMVDELNRHHE